MAERVDLNLDAMDARLDQYAAHGVLTGQDRQELADYFAELRAAREVVEAARVQWAPHGPCENRLCRAVAAYDRHAPPATHQPEGVA